MVIRAALATCILLLGPASAIAQSSGHPVPLWRIDGPSNRIYLLGSVHVLREDDHPIPAAIEQAYQDAEILIMEVDMDDLDPIEMAGLVSELGVIGQGGSLQEFMGQELYDEAERYASQLDIPIAMLAQTEPWLAALTIEQLVLVRIGFNPQYGIEFHLSGKAGKDNKEILGFETAREQLEFLDNLSLPAQRALLIQTLQDSLTIEEDIELLIKAWRYGDIDFLEDNLLAEIKEYPELYKSLVVNRNELWVQRIRGLTSESDDYLIVIGALHLVGQDGVPALLREMGITARQLTEPET